jgi:hypothetical protein
MTKARIISALLIIILTAGACRMFKPSLVPETHVYRLGDSMKVRDGSLIYALPRTVLNISVGFQRTIEKPGPYARYGSEMLGLKNVITGETERWSVTGIKTDISEEIDPSEFYVIETSTIVETNALSLKKAGLIMDLNPTVPFSAGSVKTDEQPFTGSLGFTDLGSDEYFITRNDTAFRRVKLDTAFVKIPYLVERKRPLSTEQLAERAAKALLELRDGKQFILTGEANIFPQGSAGIEELYRLEREYTALFTGKTLTRTKTISYTFIPSVDPAGKQSVLFYFSESSGPSNKALPGSYPVLVELEPAVRIKDITVITRQVEEGAPAESRDKLYYRIPEVATVRIKAGGEVIYESRILVYQLGQVIQLPSNFIIGK